MHALLLFWAFAVFITCGHCQDGGLIVFGPKKIHPKSEFTIVITNLLNQSVRLQATLENLENPSILRQVKSYNFERDTSEKLTFQVADIEKCDCYQLEVKSLDNTFSFVEHASLEYDAKTAITLIETDKPVYSPGEKLRFRVLVVDINTKPVTNIEAVDVTITDPDNRVLRTWSLARLHKGVFESDVQLSSSSSSGKWSLTVVVDGVEEHKHFEVLLDPPKFFVRASPLKPVLLEDTTISIMLETAYTFGYPVEGRYKAGLFFVDPLRQPDHIAQGQINGRTSVHFHLKDQVQDQVYMDSGSDFTQATLMVEVQATLSNHTVNITEIVPIYRHPYNMMITSKKSFKPGLPYVISLSVEDHLGRPTTGANKSNHALIRANFGTSESERNYSVSLNNYGQGSLKLDVPSNAEALSITGEYDGSSYELLSIELLDFMEQSENNVYLSVDINPKNKDIKVNSDVHLTVTSTEKMTYIAYIVVTRGNIIKCSYAQVHNRTNFNLKVRMTPEMSPESRLIVYYIKNGIVVYDDVELKFDRFNNHLAVTLDKKSYYAGETIRLTVNAAKDSYVALGAIDQSVMLMEDKRHNFDRNDVLHELAEYGQTDEILFDPIHSFGLFLRSTALTDGPPSPRGGMYRFGSPILKNRNTSRGKNIPMETFLWQNFTMSGKNTETIEVIAPTSSTKYFISGFALSPTMGLGLIKQPLQLNVKKILYLDVSLPYSVKRNEVLLVRATVFNFIQHGMTTQVTITSNKDQLEFVETSSNDQPYTSKAVIAKPNTGTSVSFMVKAKQVGLIAVKLIAHSQLAVDEKEHILRVMPLGTQETIPNH